MDILMIDGEDFSDMQQLHAHIAAQLHFPKHYGKNLDALYDCLTDMKNVEIHVHNYGVLKERLGNANAEGLMDVFLDLCAAKPACTLHVEPVKSSEAVSFSELFDETSDEETTGNKAFREEGEKW